MPRTKDQVDRNVGGTNNNSGNNNRNQNSVTVNGRVVTDPRQVETITKNREASARFAADAYRREGTPIPGHLRDTVNRQEAERQAASDARAAARPAAKPNPIAGFLTDLVDGGGRGQAGPTFVGGLGPMFNRLGVKPMGSGGGNNVVPSRLPPSPGPNYYAPLGAPGQARESNNPTQSSGMAMMSPAPMIEAAPAAPQAVDAGNAPTEDGDAVSRANAERSRVPTYEAGGMVGPNGVPLRPSTTSLDLPPALARMLALPMQSYAEGGMVGPGGVPQRPMASSPMAMNLAQQGGAPVVGINPQGGQGRPLNFAAIDQQAQQFMQQNPQQVEEIRSEVEESIASGEVDPASLNTFVQIATVSLQNPEMWPQLRQVLIQQGMLDAEDVSEEYDQGFLIILYIIGKTMGGGQAQMPGGQPPMPSGQPPMPGGQPPMPAGQLPMSAGQPPQMSMARGGALPNKSKNADGSIPINAHEGEYVIPADVTRRLGTDHFDRMIAKARDVDMKGER